MKNMNKFKKILWGFLATVILLGQYSCGEEFLEENLLTTESTQTFETPEGIDALVVGMYQTLRFHFNYEWSYTMTNFGADEMAVGNDARHGHYNDYTAAFNSLTGIGVGEVWDNMYAGIASANTVIANVPRFYPSTSAHFNTRLGEGYFIRAFNYFKLVRQYGGVPLKLTPSIVPETEFTRATERETYAQIISDFERAYQLLPTTPTDVGRITKWAAAHFLAKAHLFRASELYNSWNAPYVTADLQKVIDYSREVIAAHPLVPDFAQLWDYTAPNSANERVSEIVLSAQFSNNDATQGRYGNRVHMYFLSIYQNLAGVGRDISGGREFSRMRTTNFALDVFDRVNDSRFWKSFVTSYRSSRPSHAPTWGVHAPPGVLATARRFAGGEEAILYIVNDPGDTRYTAANLLQRAPHMFVRYFAGETQSFLEARGNSGHWTTRSRYVALSKFRDGSRNSVASEFGRRDGILARSAEAYLMVAEALGRQGNFSQALPYINALRNRAGFAEGENRGRKVDGGQAFRTNPAITIPGDGGFGQGFAVFSGTNTYWESNNIAPTTASTKSQLVINNVDEIFNSTREFYDVLGSTDQRERFLWFIMNERSRELMGELMRWEDLARTKQLERRWRAFNDGSVHGGGNFDPNKHYLRPIPQRFLDTVEKNGLPLTPEEKQAMQNPGW